MRKILKYWNYLYAILLEREEWKFEAPYLRNEIALSSSTKNKKRLFICYLRSSQSSLKKRDLIDTDKNDAL